MSQIYIIAAVLALISLLVCYLFISQTIVKKKKERARIQRALAKRVKFLIQTIDSFPQHFLSSDLVILLLRNTVDTLEQLMELAPNESHYVNNFKLYSQKLETSIKAGDKIQKETLVDTASQISEIRQALNQLNRFIQSWVQRGNISKKQSGAYKTQIKKLNAKLMVDNYVIAASQAEGTDKLKLAIHYYMLAKNTILEEGLTDSKSKQGQIIQEKLAVLETAMEQQLQERAQEKIAEGADKSEGDDQWNKLEKKDDWKKKNIYD